MKIKRGSCPPQVFFVSLLFIRRFFLLSLVSFFLSLVGFFFIPTRSKQRHGGEPRFFFCPYFSPQVFFMSLLFVLKATWKRNGVCERAGRAPGFFFVPTFRPRFFFVPTFRFFFCPYFVLGCLGLWVDGSPGLRVSISGSPSKGRFPDTALLLN